MWFHRPSGDQAIVVNGYFVVFFVFVIGVQTRRPIKIAITKLYFVLHCQRFVLHSYSVLCTFYVKYSAAEIKFLGLLIAGVGSKDHDDETDNNNYSKSPAGPLRTALFNFDARVTSSPSLPPDIHPQYRELPSVPATSHYSFRGNVQGVFGRTIQNRSKTLDPRGPGVVAPQARANKILLPNISVRLNQPRPSQISGKMQDNGWIDQDVIKSSGSLLGKCRSPEKPNAKCTNSFPFLWMFTYTGRYCRTVYPGFALRKC